MKLSKFVDNGNVTRVINFLCFIYKGRRVNMNSVDCEWSENV